MSIHETLSEIRQSLLIARMHLARVDRLIGDAHAAEPLEETPFDLHRLTYMPEYEEDIVLGPEDLLFEDDDAITTR